MNPPQTQVHIQKKTTRRVSEFRTAVSLHSHTSYSKEILDFLPHYIAFHQIPVVSRLIRAELKHYEETTGRSVDFGRAYWTPPVSPQMVLASETSQIEEKLGMAAVVSITDHDTIAGNSTLQGQPGSASIPISVEWSVPYAGNTFHVGVHHLPPTRSAEIMNELSRCTAEPTEERLSELFAFLDGFPETLLVLNHPCCNFVRVGAGKHWASLHQFFDRFRPWIHAVEMNGMRAWSENQLATGIAEKYDLPIIAGGDRHGCQPNAMLNLSQAESWGEFVAEVRIDRRTNVLVLPAYEEPVRLRELSTACDVLRHYPQHPYGQRRFTDRIFAYLEGYSWHPLSFYWDGGDGKPLWLDPIVATVIALGNDHVRPVLRRLFSLRGEYENTADRLKNEYGSEALSTSVESTPH